MAPDPSHAPGAPRLVFVYAADSGRWNALLDLAHKTLRPESYECNLCKLTYGPLGMKKEWKRFLDQLPLRTDFLHRDEFARRAPDLAVALPALLLEEGGTRRVLLDGAAIAACPDLPTLEAAVRAALDGVPRGETGPTAG